MDPERLKQGLVYLVALILSVCVHEFGHAFVADKLGDPLPRAQGRVTLNPLAHIDPIGTLLMPMIAVLSPAMGAYIVGWGRPVSISLSARSMTRKLSIRTSHALIAIAGPMMNILFALVLSGVYVLLRLKHANPQLAGGVANVVFMNVGLCFFNLLPVPPLDGGAVLARLVPRRFDRYLEYLNQYGSIILIALLVTGALSVLLTPARIVALFWLTTVVHWAGLG